MRRARAWAWISIAAAVSSIAGLAANVIAVYSLKASAITLAVSAVLVVVCVVKAFATDRHGGEPPA